MKTIFEVVKLWGGPRLHDFLSGNLGGPSIFTTKRKGKKATQFQSREHEYIFDVVGKILSNAKSKHGIASRIPIIIVEDETTIKRRIRWNAKDDTLIGFCGSKGENHQCCSNDIITIGEGSQGYEKIINAFQNHEIGNYARLLIVNRVHESLPRLALVVHCTCNHFDSIFIRAQWSHIERLWNSSLEDTIGPIIGHAIDGDSRRHKLMVEDYMAKSDQQFFIDWCGWKLKSRLIDDDVYGLHDQDFVHNGKKPISPLDSPTRQLAIGRVWITLNHVSMVYSSFPIDEHKLRDGDIQRNDRQNWGAAQRIASRQVQNLLLIKMFRDFYPNMKCPLHLTGSDAAKKIFSKIGDGEMSEDEMSDAGEHNDLEGPTIDDDELLHKDSDKNDDIIALSEIRHEVDGLLDEERDHIHQNKISLVVEVDGKTIFKSTLVSQLNGNSTLSKDRLTTVKQGVYFSNNSKSPSASNVNLLGIGSDCAVYFDDDTSERGQLQRGLEKPQARRRWAQLTTLGILGGYKDA
ncbi:hypothetical protein L7F22_008713 [Adiantum nelumboides]|nr:hypothetical protein [Adiantum nelumboides]